jgi:hypothetical protein
VLIRAIRVKALPFLRWTRTGLRRGTFSVADPRFHNRGYEVTINPSLAVPNLKLPNSQPLTSRAVVGPRCARLDDRQVIPTNFSAFGQSTVPRRRGRRAKTLPAPE